MRLIGYIRLNNSGGFSTSNFKAMAHLAESLFNGMAENLDATVKRDLKAILIYRQPQKHQK